MSEPEIQTSRLFPVRGINHVPGDGINSTVAVLDASARAKEMNSPENLLSLLTGNNGIHRVLFSYELPNNNVVSFVQPSAAYSEKGKMIIAGNKDDLVSGIIETKSIYDYPVEVQKVYFALGVSYLITSSGQSDVSNSRTVITINETPVTSDKIRTSRTIVLPHGQGNMFDFSLITNEQPTLPKSLAVEQKILNHNNKKEFVETISDLLNKNFGYKDLQFSLIARDTEPFGYSIVFNVSPENVLNNIADIQNILELNHHIYGDQADRVSKKTNLNEKSRKRLIPQPSYRMYMFFNTDQKLEIIISPEFISHAGVTEAAGIQTIRDPKTSPKFSKEEVEQDAKETTERIEAMMETNKKYWT